MKDYRLFEITDFVMDEDFSRWVFLNTTTDNEFWNNWLNQNPDKHLVVAEARKILQSLKVHEEPIPDQKIDLEVDRLMQTIRLQPEQQTQTARIFRLSPRWYAAAAILIASIAGVFYLFNSFPATSTRERYVYKTQVSTKQMVENINTSSENAKITLPDGSTVFLAPDSRISYSNNLDSVSRRDVYLSGEAFFSVVRNTEHPFRVFSNEIITKVLGTSFTVRSFESDSVIEITVKTGKVSVYSQTDSHSSEEIASKKLGGILLTANQQLVYAKTGQTFQKIITESPAIIAPEVMNQEGPYEDVPLEEVFSQLSRAYGIDIIYDSEILKNCTVTADIRNETFYHQLDLVCAAVGARYELMDGQVVIQASGCQQPEGKNVQ